MRGALGWGMGIALCFLASTTQASTSTAQDGQTSLGFLDPSHADVPPAVARAARSVFRIALLTDRDVPHRQMSRDESDQYLRETCENSAIPLDFISELNCKGIRDCIKSASETCVLPYLSGGTAFVTAQNQNTTLTTAWHVFAKQFGIYRFLAPALAAKPTDVRQQLLLQLRPHFEIYDASGALVYATPSEGTRFVELGDFFGALYAPLEKRPVAEMFEDYARVEIPGRFGSPLPLAPAPKHLSPAYAVGYPVPTARATLDRNKQSDGTKQFVSPGVFLDRDDFQTRLAAHLASQPKAESQEAATDENEEGRVKTDYQIPLERGIVYASPDVVRGNSGGPLLDEDGRVVGIIVKSFSTPEAFSPAGVLTLYHPR